MKWTHRFRVDAQMDAIYEKGFAPGKWFTFFKAYRGLESIDVNWPERGSSIAIRYAILGPWTTRLTQTIVEHEHGRLLRLHEEALRGLWLDNVEFFFAPEDGSTAVTFTSEPSSGMPLGRWLIWLFVWPFVFMTPRAMKRFKAIIEGSANA